MTCSSDITNEEVQIDQTIKKDYEPCHNCRHGVMDLVEVTTRLSILELPIWRLASNQQALHCKRCSYTVPFIEISTAQEDEHNEAEMLRSIQPSTSVGDNKPTVPQLITSPVADETNNNSIDQPNSNNKKSTTDSVAAVSTTTSRKYGEVIVLTDQLVVEIVDQERKRTKDQDYSLRVTPPNDKTAVPEIVNLQDANDDEPEIIDVVQESPTLPEIINLHDEEKDDDTARIIMKSPPRTPFQACYHNLIVITDDDEIRVSDHQPQQQLPDPAVASTTTPSTAPTSKAGNAENEVIIIDDLDDDDGIQLLDKDLVDVKVLPVVEEDAASSLSCSAYTKQSSYFPASIDLSSYGLSSWKVFSI